MEKVWLGSYPAGVPAEVDVDQYASIPDVFDISCRRFSERPCLRSMGVTLSFREVERESAKFASYLQHTLGLKKGERIAIQLPNVLQYPVVLFGALRAGLVVVNTNPLYTEREMELQFNDADVSAIVILENFASKLDAIWPNLKRKPHVITSGLADLFPALKRTLVHLVVRHVKKLVPAYRLDTAVPLRQALALGASAGAPTKVELTLGDLAFLQYTGGTTGIAKGAMLTHRNVLANMQQAAAWMAPRLTEGEEVILTPLPLYHIFSLTVNCLLFMRFGALSILVANPKDFPAFIKLLQTERFTVMTAVSTLLNALMNQPGFERIDWSSLKFTVAGAMALQRSVAERWARETKTPVIEGYGLTEASPVVCCNPLDGRDKIATIGLPFPSTEIRLVDDDGNDSPPGESGELAVRGPQVMQGYWNKPEETALVLRDGWLFTGDIAQVDPEGYLSIVDRKKDMIIVSGFNVYPNEVEEVICAHPKVQEAGAIGIPDEKSGEVVKVVVVKKDQSLTEDELVAHARTVLAGYKVPKVVEFRSELPKTNVGKILRRALR